MPMTPQEFAQTIKTKFPQYANVEDNLLVKKVIEKYPVYAKQVDLRATEPLFSAKRVVNGIIPDVVGTAKSVAQIPGIIGQTIGNVIVSPKYALKTAAGDVKRGIVGAGEAVGQAGADLAYNPGPTLKKAAIAAQKAPVTTATTALFAVPGASRLVAGKVAGLVDKASLTLAKKSLGYTKPFLKTAQARERANIVADTMLKEHVIPNLGRTKTAMSNVESLLEESGQRLATIREELQTQGLAFNPLSLDDKIKDALMPKLQGGAFDATKNTVERIRKTILAGGSENVDFKTASAILDKLNENAGYGVGATASQKATAKLYRRAAGIVSDEIDNAVEGVAKATKQPKLLEDYMNHKALYSKSKDAQKVLNRKLAGELGNQGIGLKNAIVGGVAIGTGNIGKGAAEIGLLEGAKRFVTGFGAVETRELAKNIRRIGNLGVPKGYLKYTGPGTKQIGQFLGNERGNVLLGKGKQLESEALKYKTPEEFVDNISGAGKTISFDEKLPTGAMAIINRQAYYTLGVEIPESFWENMTAGKLAHGLEKLGLGEEIFKESNIALQKAGYKRIGNLNITNNGMIPDADLTRIWNKAHGKGGK